MKAVFLPRVRLHLFTSIAILAVMLFPLAARAENAKPETTQPNIVWNPDNGQAVLTNGAVELIVETKSGINADRFKT